MYTKIIQEFKVKDNSTYFGSTKTKIVCRTILY